MPLPRDKTDRVARPEALLPPALLPILYVAAAHAALGVAFLTVALDPRAAAGFFYHARLVAIVHLVTLGWITLSILGALYIVAPLALRMPLPARAVDYWAYGLALVGVTGMVAHFWISEWSGMAWSGLAMTLALALVAGRVLAGLRAAPIPGAVKLHIGLAFVNVSGAAAMGVLLGFNKVFDFLPGFVLANVFAHAHLAAIGWAGMMVVGVGYRLIPMVLPAALPRGPSVYLTAVLLEAGAVGLFVTLIRQSPWTPVFAALAVAGFATFLGHVAWMTRHPRPAPVELVRPDYGVGHVIVALGYLGVTAVVGLVLVMLPASEALLRLALVYGVFGLVGFLAQMVVGMEMRVLPLFAWYRAFARTGYRGPVPSPHGMPARVLQRWTFAFWVAGVPALAAGFGFNAPAILAAGAWTLFAGVVFAGCNAARILAHAVGGRGGLHEPAAPTGRRAG